MSVRIEFTLPEPALRKLLTKYVVIACLGVALIMFNPNMTPTIFAATGAVLFLVFGWVYRAQQRHVWVSVSDQGLHGNMPTGGELTLGWDDEILLLRGKSYGMEGLVVRPKVLGDGQAPRAPQIFIPGAIVESENFRAALMRLAPPGHALSPQQAAPPAAAN